MSTANASPSRPNEMYRVVTSGPRISFLSPDGDVLADFGFGESQTQADFYGTFREADYDSTPVTDLSTLPWAVAEHAPLCMGVIQKLTRH